jgi:hypothetical protein
MFGAQKKPSNSSPKAADSSGSKPIGYDLARLQVRRHQENNMQQGQANQPAPQNMLQNRNGKLKGEIPLSVPGFDPLRPEDDIVTFFKNRIPGEPKKSAVSVVVSTLIVVLLLLVAFVLGFNFNNEFRSVSRQFASNHLQIDLVKFIPKLRPVGLDDDLGEGLTSVSEIDAKSLQSTNTLEQSMSLIRRGSWGYIDKKISGTCSTWTSSLQCLVKGYYLASRGLKSSAKMILNVPETSLRSLSNTEQATWFHTLALVKENNSKNFREFAKSHQLLGEKNPATKAVFFDDIIRMHILRGNVSDALYFYGLAKKQLDQKRLNYFQSKWGVLIILASKKPVTNQIVDRALQSGRSAFKNDPLSLELLVKAAIVSGQFVKIRPLIMDAVTENESQGINKEIRKRLWQLRIRTDLGTANRAEANKGLEFYRAAFGIDVFYQMMNLSLAINPLSVFPSERVERLWGSVPISNLPWEAKYLVALADIRSHRISNSLKDIQHLEQTIKLNPRYDAAWISLLRGEYKYASKKFAESKALAQNLAKDPKTSLFGYDLLIRNAQALRQFQEVGRLRSEIDKIRNLSVFGRSDGYMRSPFGPLSLLN